MGVQRRSIDEGEQDVRASSSGSPPLSTDEDVANGWDNNPFAWVRGLRQSSRAPLQGAADSSQVATFWPQTPNASTVPTTYAAALPPGPINGSGTIRVYHESNHDTTQMKNAPENMTTVMVRGIASACHRQISCN